MSVVSDRPPAVSPSQPPASGLLTANTSAAIAAIRIAMISHCRSLAYPRDIRLAASRNIIAAHLTV